MKKIGILLVGLTALTAVSCSTTEETTDEEQKVEAVTYKLDKEGSSIKWHGQMSAEYGHDGTVDFSKGSITMEGSELKSGSFTIDMTSLKNTDLPAEKGSYLVGHLQGTIPDDDHAVDMFFNTPKFPNVEVTLGSYEDGKLDVTLNILGKKLKQSVSAVLTSSSSEAFIKGTFSLDLSSLGIPGLQVGPDGSQISPSIDFEVIVALKK